jgi:hypothetical protein
VGVVVAAVFEVAGLHLVDAVQLDGVQAEVCADLGCRLNRT